MIALTASRHQVSTAIDVVGIGAAAGGSPAIAALFRSLPGDTGAAYVVVIDSDPDERNMLSGVLGQSTAMPVKVVRERTRLAADTVYVVGADQTLSISGSHIETSSLTSARGRRAPIDKLFCSIAGSPRGGIAVVLSGEGTDGAVGAAAVSGRGGLVLAQDPADAETPSMPKAAIAVGADIVAPACLLGPRIAVLIKARQAFTEGDFAPSTEGHVRDILTHVRDVTGHDFRQYKRGTIERRIARRVQITHSGDIAGYADLVRKDAAETRRLFQDLLISVTRFFRDAASFETLARLAITPLVSHRRPPQDIRIWVAGCATGEEAYSIAMLLIEAADRCGGSRPAIQIFATDLDEAALAVARAGRYPKSIEADVSPARRARFFTATNDGYQVNPELRDLIVFSVHDVLADPPFARLDLISCRNLLIYLGRTLQIEVCETFSYALRAGGFLLLGASETAGAQADLFERIDREASLYQIKAPARIGAAALVRAPAVRRAGAGALRVLRPEPLTPPDTPRRPGTNAFTPPSVLVDARHRVVNVSESAGRFLQHPAGTITTDAVSLVRPELALDLHAALHRAFEHGERTVTLPIPVMLDGARVQVVLLVAPVDAETGGPLAMAAFLEGGPADHDAPDDAGSQDSGGLASKLREELSATRKLLRASREQYEQATDELRAANEELQSVNEEYRATAEELETSKEELQSINEELQTLNAELSIRLSMVSQTNNDLLNLMAASDIATLFLNADLQIMRFTPLATSLFNLHSGDEGRPITDFTHRLNYAGLVTDARKVLATHAPVERLVTSTDDRHFTLRLRPYRTAEDRIEGVVVTFFDDTEKHKAETAFMARQKLLLGEMAHRAKNTLAVVHSLIRQSLRRTSTPPEVLDELLGRLVSLSRSHDLLLATDWTGADLAELVDAQVLPHAPRARIRVDGVSATIPADVATPLGLVLNELVTNAAKYGSLSLPDGGIDIAWRVETDGAAPVVVLTWAEHGGPPVVAPAAQGAGLRLIECCLPAGTVKLEFARDGLRARITLPWASR